MYNPILNPEQVDFSTTLMICVVKFQMLYNVHLATEKMDDTAMMSDQTRVLLAGCDGLTVDISRLKLALNVRCYNDCSGGTRPPNLTFKKGAKLLAFWLSGTPKNTVG